jgi:hypothetical protein
MGWVWREHRRGESEHEEEGEEYELGVVWIGVRTAARGIEQKGGVVTRKDVNRIR